MEPRALQWGRQRVSGAPTSALLSSGKDGKDGKDVRVMLAGPYRRSNRGASDSSGRRLIPAAARSSGCVSVVKALVGRGDRTDGRDAKGRMEEDGGDAGAKITHEPVKHLVAEVKPGGVPEQCGEEAGA